MSNDVKLEPCPAPWCDKDEPDVEVAGYRGMKFVVCGNCGCTGPEGNSPAAAATAWNTRHQPQREAVLDLDAAAKRFQYEHRNACYPDATELEAREAAEQIVRAALTTPAPAVKPHCSTCGKDVAEVLCETCGKWWADNPPPTPAVSTDEIDELLYSVIRMPLSNKGGELVRWRKTMSGRLSAILSRLRGEGE